MKCPSSLSNEGIPSSISRVFVENMLSIERETLLIFYEKLSLAFVVKHVQMNMHTARLPIS